MVDTLWLVNAIDEAPFWFDLGIKFLTWGLL